MKLGIPCGLLIMLMVLSGCSLAPEQNQDSEQTQDPSIEQDARHIREYQQNQFDEIKGEIDYWHSQSPRSIGSQHKQQMMDRLLAVNSDQVDKDEYIQKLNSILLVDDPAYEEQREQQPVQDPQDQAVAHVLRYCSGNGSVPLISSPIPLEDLGYISPKGAMTGHHVTPTDHGFVTSKMWTNPDAKREDHSEKFANVLAPADGIVIGVDEMPSVFATSTLGDYHITIYHTCTFYTVFIHVNEISDKLRTILQTRNPAAVKAGEVIGRSPAFDFSVFNQEVTLTVVNRGSYQGVESMLNSDDLFVHFAEPIKTQLQEKSLRKAQPPGGKMDYDVDRTIAGNWFVENTYGYKGLPEYNRLLGYWKTHLAFVYDPIDPDVLIVSMGDYDGQTAQYAVKGNTPDFADVTPESGMIEYELVKYDYLDEGKVWDKGHYAELTVKPRGEVVGAALVQMLGDREIKFEAFPGKKSSAVSGFTAKVKRYER